MVTDRPVTKPRREPVRTCVACRVEGDKRDLVRIVRIAGDGAAVDLTGHAAGRGAYIHANAGCISVARKRRAIERSLNTTVTANVWDEINKIDT